MKCWMNYLFIENQEDFDRHYDKTCKRLNHILLYELPNKFPICYKFKENCFFDTCWEECDINEAIIAWNKEIHSMIDLVNDVMKIFNTNS